MKYFIYKFMGGGGSNDVQHIIDKLWYKYDSDRDGVLDQTETL